jgi:hypothetical protein
LWQDGDEEVALESCEFWSAFCEAQIPSTVLAEFLPRLIPVLMKNMMFDELDDEVLEVEAADDAVNKVRANVWSPVHLFCGLFFILHSEVLAPLFRVLLVLQAVWLEFVGKV